MTRRDSSIRRHLKHSRAKSPSRHQQHPHPDPTAAHSNSMTDRHRTESLLDAPEGAMLDAGGLLIVHPPLSDIRIPSGGSGIRGKKSLDIGRHEKYTCRFCEKMYVGKNARSVARRHLQDKHDIPLSQQVRRSRWDKSRREASQTLVQSVKETEPVREEALQKALSFTLIKDRSTHVELESHSLPSSPVGGLDSMVRRFRKRAKKTGGLGTPVNRGALHHIPDRILKTTHTSGSAKSSRDCPQGDDVFRDPASSSIALPRQPGPQDGPSMSGFTLGQTTPDDSSLHCRGHVSNPRLLFRQARLLPPKLAPSLSTTSGTPGASLKFRPPPQLVDMNRPRSPTRVQSSTSGSWSSSTFHADSVDDPFGRPVSEHQRPVPKPRGHRRALDTPATEVSLGGFGGVSAPRFWQALERGSPPSKTPTPAIFQAFQASNPSTKMVDSTTDNLFLCSPAFAGDPENELNTSPGALHYPSIRSQRPEGSAHRAAGSDRVLTSIIPTPMKMRRFVLSSPESMDPALSLGLVPSHPPPNTPGLSSIIGHCTPGEGTGHY